MARPGLTADAGAREVNALKRQIFETPRTPDIKLDTGSIIGCAMEEILPLMDGLTAQGDQGAFTFGEFARNAPAVYSACSAIGTSTEHIR